MNTHAAMTLRDAALLTSLILLSLLTACSTPQQRAAQRAGPFGKLSAGDKKLVLGGRVRPGMNPDAVFIAWGAPDWLIEDGKSKTSETWIFARELSVSRPLGYYDCAYPSFEQRGPSFAYGIPGRDDFGAEADDSGWAYPPRALVTDVRLRQARFVDRKLEHYEIRRGAPKLIMVDHS